MRISRLSTRNTCMATRCERCGVGGYIFPDQLKPSESYYLGDKYMSKCCNGRRELEKHSRCLYMVQPERANRLQNIRARGTDMGKNGVGNF